MKRKILCLLLVCCLLLLSGCREPVPPQVNTTATEPSIAAVESPAGTIESTTAATEPEQTQPADSTSKETSPTEPKLEQIDIAALEAYGRSYASGTYGYNGTSACSPNTGAGYFPGATKEIPTMEDGYKLVRQAIDAQYYRDIACGYLPYEEINGIIVRCPINICIEFTGQSGVYIIWVYYGGYA